MQSLAPTCVRLIQFCEGFEAPLGSYRTNSLNHANPSNTVIGIEHSRMNKKECVGHACRGLAPIIAEIVPVIADEQRYATKQ